MSKRIRIFFTIVTCTWIAVGVFSDLGLCDEPREAEKESVEALARRACIRLEEGDYEAGISLLWKAIKRNPGDVGQIYKPRVAFDDSDKRWGERQVRRMLSDRPFMRGEIDEHDELWNWAISRFAGVDTSRRVLWNPAQPISEAQCIPHSRFNYGQILVSRCYLAGQKKGKDLTFEDAWSSAAFELQNLKLSENHNRLVKQARVGSITKQAYVRSVMALEFIAMQETRAFYVTVALPWMAKKQHVTDPELWYTHSACWGSFDDFLAEFSDALQFHFDSYGEFYDECAEHFLSRLSEDIDSDISIADIEAIRTFSVYDQRALKALADALRESTPHITEQAVRLIDDMQLAERVLNKVLLAQLASDNMKVSEEAILSIRSLGKLARPAAPELQARLRTSEDLISVELLSTLLSIGNPSEELLPKLLKLLSSDVPQVRINSLRTIRQLNDSCSKEAVEAVKALLGDDDEAVSSAARDTLSHLRKTRRD
jgi:hypothetical protein